MLRTIGVLAALILAVVACTGPGATTAPTGTAAPTASPTMAATASPTMAASPTGSPTTEPSPTDGASPSPTGEASPTAAPTPTPPPGAVAGTLTIWADEQRAPIFIDIGADFTAATSVPVVVHQVGFGDIRNNLVLRGPAGEGPDIIIGAHDWLGQLVTAGLVEPLDLGDKADSFDPVAIRAMSYNDQLYAVPYAIEAIALYYNADLVPTPPATWDELRQTASDLQEAGTVQQGYCLQQGDPYHSYPILSGNGGYIFGGDAAANEYDPQDVGLDSPGGIAYANELDSLVKEGLLRPDIDYGACLTMMTTGEAAFWITGPWALSDFVNSGINFGVAPIPTMTEEALPFVGVQGMMVNSNAANKLLATEFLREYMATDEAMEALYVAGQRPPAWLPTAETVTDEHVLTFAEVGSTGHPMPSIPEMDKVWTHWTTAINLIFTQAQDPEPAIRDAAENVRGEIEP